jgi:hypothetical protein
VGGGRCALCLPADGWSGRRHSWVARAGGRAASHLAAHVQEQVERQQHQYLRSSAENVWRIGLGCSRLAHLARHWLLGWRGVAAAAWPPRPMLRALMGGREAGNIKNSNTWYKHEHGSKMNARFESGHNNICMLYINTHAL